MKTIKFKGQQEDVKRFKDHYLNVVYKPFTDITFEEIATILAKEGVLSDAASEFNVEVTYVS